MRTQEERLHMNTVAVKKQVVLAATLGGKKKKLKEAIKQPNRLSKVKWSKVGPNANESKNPRNKALKSKDKMTHQELIQSQINVAQEIASMNN